MHNSLATVQDNLLSSCCRFMPSRGIFLKIINQLFAMKLRRISVRCFAFLAFLALCSFGLAQMPAGFPTMPNTGNPAADAEAYEQAKQVWTQNNPSSPVNGNGNAAPVLQSTEAQNAAYEAAKIQAGTVSAASPAELAAHQLRKLETEFSQNHAQWAEANGRLHAAYLDVFAMARGQNVVTITAQDYASFYPELKNLVDANPALFNITQ
jgi:hypothetical protein